MKKSAIGSLAGGIILFVWQTLSNTALQLHYSSVKYTPKQDTIMAFLGTQFNEDGRYYMPSLPQGASVEDFNKLSKSKEGKPWAIISYHQSLNISMALSMVRTLVIDILVVWLLCWILLKFSYLRMRTVFLSALFTGLIVFLNGSYTEYIWYQDAGIWAHLFDAVASWGLCGLWLGKWLPKADA